MKSQGASPPETRLKPSLNHLLQSSLFPYSGVAKEKLTSQYCRYSFTQFPLGALLSEKYSFSRAAG